MTDWRKVAIAGAVLIGTVATRKLIFYAEDRLNAHRYMKIMLHRAARTSKRALEHEDRMARKLRNRIRLLK